MPVGWWCRATVKKLDQEGIATSKLPTPRVASKERPLALPNEVRQALNEAAGRAGGLLAMSVATGLTVMAAMM